MTVIALHQPAPDVIDTPEQALAVLMHTDDLDGLVAAYATGAVEGALIGRRYRLGLISDDDEAAHDRYYGSQSWPYAPATVREALIGLRRVTDPARQRDLIKGAGWLRFFTEQLHGADGAVTCEVCGRGLVLEIDQAFRCAREDVWGCRWHDCGTVHADCAAES